MGSLTAGTNPLQFQRAIAFVDGTNLHHRLRTAKFKIKSLRDILAIYVGGRQLLRANFYTIKKWRDAAIEWNGDMFLSGMRVVLGEGIPTGDGNEREKGVDALLVADLIYNAAMKNIDYALLLSADLDFAYAIRRVEDFGCRTGVMSLLVSAPEGLRVACDDYIELD